MTSAAIKSNKGSFIDEKQTDLFYKDTIKANRGCNRDKPQISFDSEELSTIKDEEDDFVVDSQRDDDHED